MAVYKVPQDVEAEDKLLGPFSFKQFIFLIITVMALGIAYGLSQILLPLAIIPLPIAIFFAILALPLRKDQPMEVYMAAVISFILKPKVRLWRPDGIEALIEVIAPKNEDRQYGKGYSQEEVQKRLSYLANLVDSRGWSVRGVNEPDSSMRADLYNEAQAMDDLLDEQGSRAQQIDSLLTRTDNQRRQELLDRMQQGRNEMQTTQATNSAQTYYSSIPNPTPTQPYSQSSVDDGHLQVSPIYTPMSVVEPTSPDEDIRLTINPYPSIKQSVISPISDSSHQPATSAATSPSASTPSVSETTVSPAIIDLAKNHADLSVETLQREANRIREKESEEVVISLR